MSDDWLDGQRYFAIFRALKKNKGKLSKHEVASIRQRKLPLRDTLPFHGFENYHDGLAFLIMNKPLQVYLDEDDLMRLEAFARARGWTKSQTIRAAIRALTRRTAEDPVLDPALRALDRIDASPRVSVRFATAGDHDEGRRWLERLVPRPITYTDAVSFAVMAATKCKHVLGFHGDFAAGGFELWRGD